MMNKYLRSALIVLFILTIGYTVFSLINFNKNKSVVNKNSSITEWTQYEKDSMVQDCINHAPQSNAEDSAGTRKLCQCGIDDITAKYSRKELTNMNGKPEQELEDRFTPILEKCYDSLQKIK